MEINEKETLWEINLELKSIKAQYLIDEPVKCDHHEDT